MTSEPDQARPRPLRRALPSSRPPIRVLIADDHAILRQALRALLETKPRIEIVGEAGSGDDAVADAERLKPDVVLMDMVMPGLDGIEATRRIGERVGRTRVLILSAYLEDERLFRALRAGASGYVMKNAGLEELLLAIEAVHRGNTYFSSSVSDEVAVEDVMRQVQRPGGKVGYESLTPREREILQLVAEGYSNQQIAEGLRVSVKTVESHRGHILAKLHAKSRSDLIRYALRHGIIDPGPPGDPA